MSILILNETEGYTEKILAPIIPIFEECRIKVIFNHCFLSTDNDRESTPTILQAMDYAPLQPNSAYFICKFEDAKAEHRRSAVIKELETPQIKRGSVFIETGKFSRHFEWVFPWDGEISKDILFHDQATQEIIGWYNKNTNILWMCDIGNYPETALSNIEKVMGAVLRYVTLGRIKITSISIGADPEFEVLNKRGELIDADSLFPDPRKTKLIGTDGHAATGEIRPSYAMNPLKLSRNIKRLIRKIGNNPNVDSQIGVYAGGGTKVLTGGHIHFGIKTMPEDLKEALWKLVATPVLKYQGKLRHGDTSKCKKNGTDILRNQPHGLEWRVLPSFIINEEITQAVLCTTYVIVKSYFNGGLPNTTGKTAYTKLGLYEPYQPYIDKFVELFVKPYIEREDATLLENRNILKEWKLSKLNKKPSVIITCSDGELEKFFTPLYVKLNDTVRVKIQFGPDQYITVHNAPNSTKEQLRRFAKKHFIEFIPPGGVREEREGEEGIAIAPTRPGRDDAKLARYDFVIFLPIFWNPKDVDVAEGMFMELKDIIRDAIIEFDKNRRPE